MAKTWIEAALNGPWGRTRQPGVPLSVDEIVADGLAAASAGAAIIHVHAFDVQSGQQDDRWETYARIIEGIRARVDVIIYPTIPLAGSGYADGTSRSRFAHIEELASRKLIEWTVCDPGSVNFLRYDEMADTGKGFVYRNAPLEIRDALSLCQQHGLHPGYAIYEPGFTRAGATLAGAQPGLRSPIYRFMFSDEFAWGFPPEQRYLDAHVTLLRQCDARAPWMVAGLGVDIRPLIAPAVSGGGHVRVGLEDAPWGSALTNAQWVQEAARAIMDAGGEIATAADVRAVLAS